ncbi:hypothetical protein QZH41_014561 [Actinostola sp. cb2023]|nr:hypothetical protein QZH41_014561 [Actinostola sp. cb2023]
MMPNYTILIILQVAISSIYVQGVSISGKKTLIWGPGLTNDAVLPARYFFIQAVDTNGRNLTESPGEQTFDVKLNNKVKAVPGGGVYHEGCDCPEVHSVKWESAMQCPDNYSQIERDLERFPKINLKRLAKEGVERFGVHNALCHYSVVDNKVYRKTHGEHVGFSMFMDNILLSLSRKVRLPDMEFFVNLGDWPLEKRTTNPLPILSWCGSEETMDVVMPTYDLTEAALEAMGRVSLDMLSVQANTGPMWKDKTPKAFWRGRDSREERLNLVVMGRKKPELYDVALTNFFFFPYDEKKYGPKMQHISFFDFFKWKYQINIDGTVAAYRLPYLIAGDSVVLKQDSDYYEHFYKDLEPWVHYIPFNRDLSDLEEKLNWTINNDDKVQVLMYHDTKAMDVVLVELRRSHNKHSSTHGKIFNPGTFFATTGCYLGNTRGDKPQNQLFIQEWSTSNNPTIAKLTVNVSEYQRYYLTRVIITISERL